jgi:hypothetical protein
MTEVAAASLLAVIGVFDLVGTLCSGWLTDRYDARWLLFWYYGLRGLSLLALPFVIGSSNLGLIAFLVFYGLDWVATVPPTVAITAQAFGREHVGVTFGWIFGAHQLGAALPGGGAAAPGSARLPDGVRDGRPAVARRGRARDPITAPRTSGRTASSVPRRLRRDRTHRGRGRILALLLPAAGRRTRAS